MRTARESNEFNINKYFIRLTSIGMHRSLVTRLVDTKMLVLFWFLDQRVIFLRKNLKEKESIIENVFLLKVFQFIKKSVPAVSFPTFSHIVMFCRHNLCPNFRQNYKTH